MIDSIKNFSVISKNKLETNNSFNPDEKFKIKDLSSNEITDSEKNFNPDKKFVAKEMPERIKCINDDLKGEKNPRTGVPYEEKIVKNAEGKEVIGVFPVFEYAYELKLPDNLLQSTDRKQFAECNKQLKDSVDKNPNQAKKFNAEQLEQINDGYTPDGYTWHHNEETGKMQLVDSATHTNTKHTGGRYIWGGGSQNR